MFQKSLLLAFCLLFGLAAFSQTKTEIASPNGKIKIEIILNDQINYSVFYDEIKLLEQENLTITVKNQDILGENPKLKSQKRTEVNEELTPVVPLKFSTVSNHYKALILNFNGKYSAEFRVFDDGYAYRFITDLKGDVEIMDENIDLNFPDNYTATLQQTESFKSSYEQPYTHLQTENFSSETTMSSLPVLLSSPDGTKILFSESDVLDYPALFLKANEENRMYGVFPKVPLTFEDDGDRSVTFTKTAEYIAKTTGKRGFPWRYFVISNDDKELLTNTMTFKLAPENVLKNTDWIKPGKVSWEWWNGASPYHVDFKAGYNEETYKYFIDFASEFGIPYIIMDEGWAKTTTNPYTPNPDIDLFELIRYGKEKNVKIVLWLTWLTVEHNFDLFKTFNEWGIAGVKIDFMDRSDQWMVNFYERVAKEAAKNEMFVDFHGAFKPAGLERKYPNVLSYEGVLGLEQMERATPENSLYLPFIRNAVGPMDFTPGAMINMQPEIYYSRRPNSAGMGTRAYQMALFVVFESGLQMLADNPTNYLRERECTEFITSVPTTWDETIPLEGKVGEYALIAKRKGDVWFIGGITNGEKKERTFTVPLNFLKQGQNYEMTSFVDGINAGTQALDYEKKSQIVEKESKIDIKMAKNGGFSAILKLK
ncbi:glycoside hydrolase family 97 protein [Flavimarina sp. Hel_I_48]|uniref:glycoside hydrolase family 97 protein n=1 Tax=Flavimarina sp. Hel_I_48 TaxID=1392488 RepID=UPI0004DFC7D4|nr:glycoside hydrolase family 97 protein [Flavimarina sp. Hel_I_48]